MAAIDPLTAGAVLLATAATDAVYVMFTSAVVARKRVPAATWSSVWYLLSSYAVISYTENWVYVAFAALAITIDIPLPSRGAGRPSFASSFALLEIEGAGKTGCLLHPRSRVRFAQTKVHTSIQGSGSIPAFPAQWLYGL